MNLIKTGHDAFICKQALFHKGYIDYLEGNESHLTDVTRLSSRSPLLNRVYHARFVVIHQLLSKSLQACRKVSNNSQLLILGAGLDTSIDKYDTKRFKVDLSIPASNISPKSIFIEGNLNNISVVFDRLQANGFNNMLPTVVLLECVLSYLSADSVDSILEYISHELPSVLILLYDPILPKPCVTNGYSTAMLEHFQSQGAPLLSVHESPEDILHRMKRNGWDNILCGTMSQALASLVTAKNRRILAELEPFDEFAALAILHRSYAVTLASTSSNLFVDCLCDIYKEVTESIRPIGTDVVFGEVKKYFTQYGVSGSFSPSLEEGNASAALLAVIAQSLETKSLQTEFHIRVALTSDLPAICELIRSNLEVQARKYNAVRRHVNSALKKLSQQTKLDGVLLMLVVTANGLAVGDADAVHSNASAPVACGALSVAGEATGVGRLLYFSVDPRFLRRGLAGTLLDVLLKYGKSVGLTQIALSTIADLTAARCMYRSRGFEEMAVSSLSDGCEMCEMQIDLSLSPSL